MVWGFFKKLLMLCFSLDHNQIGDIGAIKIAESLATNTALTALK